MESISRNVADLSPDERSVYETVLGHQLRENQRVIINVVEVDMLDTSEEQPSPSSPLTIEDYAIFSDLSEQEVNDLEDAIVHRSPSRPIDI